MSNSLLEPIHGISLNDYSAMCAKIASGIDEKTVLQKMGIEKAIFDEVNALWITRMQEDSTFEVTTKFGQFFGEVDQHPKLGNLKVELSDEGRNNLEKLKIDRYFFEELSGARQAAYDYVYDGAQWIQDNFGISLGDFQAVAMQWMQSQQDDVTNNDGEITHHFLVYQQQKQKEYADKFAKEQGGNIADDVEF